MTEKRYNEEFIELLGTLNAIMLKQGETFRARAYQKAQETIMSNSQDITNISQLKNLPGIGATITDKLEEYIKTGTLRALEKEKNNPIIVLGDIYGVGPKKAQELISSGITTIAELRTKQHEVLNDIQQVGLKYYEQLLERIPRNEINEYNSVFKTIFGKVSKIDSKYEIVGSYRRGAQTSGDIDVIITGQTGAVYKAFVDELINIGVILEVLSRGPSKTLVIAKLSNSKIARRVDFLYSPPDEYAFAILYFTGSKIFNTVMRQHGLNKGYTFNEHGIYYVENKTKGAKVNNTFVTEKDIFDFLGLEFKTPLERVDGRSIIISNGLTNIKKNKTLKKRENIIIVETIESIIVRFKHNGVSVLDTLAESQLNNIIKLCNDKYYNQCLIMSDNQYDIIKEYTEQKYPDNTVIHEVGAKVSNNKSLLPYEMPSMNKIKPDTNALISWLQLYTGNYVASCKLDGVSGLYTTEETTPKLYTRGNGKIGQNISHLIPYLRLPKTKGIVVRGEFVIPKTLFYDKYRTNFANPRNMVAGLINQKQVSDAINDLHFVAYEIIVPDLTPTEQMQFLETIDIERVLYYKTNTITKELLSHLLVEWRKTYMYEIDGVIVTNDTKYSRSSKNPEHAFAFKMVLTDQIAEAKVLDVIWTPSKDGYLKPRVQIEPIHLGGVTIEFATGFNGAFIKENKIGIGATIEIIRSGDVIPHIRSVTVPAEEAKMPSVPFKWNDTHVDIILEHAENDTTVIEKNVSGFFIGIRVDGLSSGNVARLIKSGFSSVSQIIHMTEQDFLTVEGFKGKLANKIFTGIRDKLKSASIITLMSASNIFGRGFSDKKMEIVLNEFPDILVSLKTNAQKIEDIASVKGMASKTAEAFVSKIDEFKQFLFSCDLEYKLNVVDVVKPIVNQSNPLFNKSVVLTGTRDERVLAFLKTMGAKQTSNVSKNTFLVIAKNKDEDTGKAEEARKLNIPIMTVNEFILSYKMDI